MTLYGDVVAPRGGVTWVGNVIDVCGAIGISETHVRTAVSRLVARDRLIGERRGRLSFYRLAEAAHEEFQKAADIIYAGELKSDSRHWTLVALDAVADRQLSITELARLGFVRVSTTIMAAAGRCGDLPVSARNALRFDAQLDAFSPAALQAFVAANWPLDDLQAAYGTFVSDFASLAKTRVEDPESCLLLRLLLVNEFRRLALVDPGLPKDALPRNWAGRKARALFSAAYRALTPGAESHIAAHFVDEKGPLAAETEETRRSLETLQKNVEKLENL